MTRSWSRQFGDIKDMLVAFMAWCGCQSHSQQHPLTSCTACRELSWTAIEDLLPVMAPHLHESLVSRLAKIKGILQYMFTYAAR